MADLDDFYVIPNDEEEEKSDEESYSREEDKESSSDNDVLDFVVVDDSTYCDICKLSFPTKIYSKHMIWNCEVCGTHFPNCVDYTNHFFFKCAQCSQIYSHTLIKELSIAFNHAYYQVYDWNTYPLEDVLIHYSTQKPQELHKYPYIIDVRGCCYGTYLTKSKLNLGELCDQCFKKLEKEGSLVLIWSH